MKLLSLMHCCAFVNEFFYRLCKAHGRPRDFFQGFAIYGSGKKVPQAGSRDGTPVGSRASLLDSIENDA